MPEPINAAAIPGANLRPDMVDLAATEMSGIGDKVGTQAATVVSTWQRLSAHYDAPEDTTLFGVMDPVKTHGETFDANIGKVSSALHTYAAEVEPIKAELARIKTEAQNFLVSIAGGVEKTTYSRAGAITTTVEWHEDQDTVDANNALIARVNDQMELLWAAERKCANAIYDIVGFPHIEAATDSNPNGYGVEEIPEGAETPWGAAVERTESCGEKAVGAVKSFVWDGVVVGGIWGTVVGLGTLTLGYNPQTGEWFSGDAYAAAWSNLGMLAVGLATVGPVSTPLIMAMPGPVGDFLRRGQQTLLNAGKGLIAYDQWSKDPAAAAGTAVFNIASIVVPVGAATAPVRTSASTAAAAVRTTARVLNYVDPASLSLQGVGTVARIALPSVGDAVRALDFGAGGNRIAIDIPTLRRTDITVDTPRAEVDVDVPVRAPEDAVDVPVRPPELVGVGSGNGGGGTVTVGSGGRGIDVTTGGGGSAHPPAGGTGGGATNSIGSGGGIPGGVGVDLPGGAGAVPGGGGAVPGGAGAVPGGGGSDVPGGTGGAGDNPGGAAGSDGGNPTGGGAGSTDSGTPWKPELGDPTLSSADYGPDFVRDHTVRGNDLDPDYGQVNGSGGQLDPRYAPPPLDQVPAEVRDLVTDPDAPFGRGADGQPYTQSQWEARYLDENSRPIYPGNDGAVPGRRVDFSSVDEFTAHYGDVLDRMGGTRGDFMSFPGTPFEHRGLPGSNLSAPYLTMRLSGDLPPNLRIEVSEVAPAYGQPGGGLQVRVIELGDDGAVRALSVDELRRNGVLEVVGDTSRMPAGTLIDDAPNTHYSDRWDQPDLHGSDHPDGGSTPDDPTGGSATPPDSTPDPDLDPSGGTGADPADGATDPDLGDGLDRGYGDQLHGAGAERGLDPSPETIQTGMVRMEDHPDYPATVARLEELGYTLRPAGRGEDPHVSIVHVHDGRTGPVTGVERTVTVVPGMRYLDLEHEVGHVNQMTDPNRFPDGPPATRHAYYDDNGKLRHIKNRFPELTARQDDVVEYHVRLEEYLRLHDRDVPADVLAQHRDGLLGQRGAYLKRLINHRDVRPWRDSHFPDIPALEARVRELGGF